MTTKLTTITLPSQKLREILWQHEYGDTEFDVTVGLWNKIEAAIGEGEVELQCDPEELLELRAIFEELGWTAERAYVLDLLEAQENDHE